MSRYLALILLFITSQLCPKQVGADSFYLPPKARRPAPALIILSCTGATQADLDSCRPIADSLGWALATCARSRNHREVELNDYDIMCTYRTLMNKYSIDRDRVFIYGFSGQGVQALMAVFLHPDILRGAISICGHDGALELARWEELHDKAFYLVTREQDWNREANIRMSEAFKKAGVRNTLVMTKGKHEPKGYREVWKGCRWLNSNTK